MIDVLNDPKSVVAAMIKRGLIIPPTTQQRTVDAAAQRERKLARQRLAMARLRQRQRLEKMQSSLGISSTQTI